MTSFAANEEGFPELNVGQRYPELERRFFRDVLFSASYDNAGARGHIHRISQRMKDGADEYGSAQFWKVPISKLLQEVREEADDVFGWGSLLALRLVEIGREDLWTPLAQGLAPAARVYSVTEAIEAQIGDKADVAYWPLPK